jgi:large-conductance mechanosensitive channel
MTEAKEPSGWHLKREIQVTHLISTILIAASVFMYVTKLEQRIAIIESQAVAQRERDSTQDARAQEMQKILTDRLDKIDNKLDRLIERRNP